MAHLVDGLEQASDVRVGGALRGGCGEGVGRLTGGPSSTRPPAHGGAGAGLSGELGEAAPIADIQLHQRRLHVEVVDLQRLQHLFFFFFSRGRLASLQT